MAIRKGEMLLRPNHNSETKHMLSRNKTWPSRYVFQGRGSLRVSQEKSSIKRVSFWCCRIRQSLSFPLWNFQGSREWIAQMKGTIWCFTGTERNKLKITHADEGKKLFSSRLQSWSKCSTESAMNQGHFISRQSHFFMLIVLKVHMSLLSSDRLLLFISQNYGNTPIRMALWSNGFLFHCCVRNNDSHVSLRRRTFGLKNVKQHLLILVLPNQLFLPFLESLKLRIIKIVNVELSVP